MKGVVWHKASNKWAVWDGGDYIGLVEDKREAIKQRESIAKSIRKPIDYFVPESMSQHKGLIKAGANRISCVRRIGWEESLSEAIYTMWKCMSTYNQDLGDFDRYYRRAIVFGNCEFLKKKKKSKQIDWPVDEDGNDLDFAIKPVGFDKDEWNLVLGEIGLLRDELRNAIYSRLDRAIKTTDNAGRANLGGKKLANLYQKALKQLRRKLCQ